jgi:hypothetical protein
MHVTVLRYNRLKVGTIEFMVARQIDDFVVVLAELIKRVK